MLENVGAARNETKIIQRDNLRGEDPARYTPPLHEVYNPAGDWLGAVQIHSNPKNEIFIIQTRKKLKVSYFHE